MLRAARLLSLLAVLAALVAAALTGLSRKAEAQVDPVPPKRINPEKALKSEDRKNFNALVNKGVPKYTPEDQPLIRLGVQDYIYPLTYSENYKPEDKDYRPGKYAKVIEQAELLIDTQPNGNNDDAVKQVHVEAF